MAVFGRAPLPRQAACWVLLVLSAGLALASGYVGTHEHARSYPAADATAARTASRTVGSVPAPAAAPSLTPRPPVAALSIPLAAALQGVEDMDLPTLFSAYWASVLDSSPEYATIVGLDGENGRAARLSDLSEAALETQHSASLRFLERARTLLAGSGLSTEDVLNAKLLVRTLEAAVKSFDLLERHMPITQLDGIQIELPQLVGFTQFRSAADYENYLERLAALPQHMEQVIALLSAGMAANMTIPKVALLGVPDQIAAQCGPCDKDASISDAVIQKSAFFAPFLHTAANANSRASPHTTERAKKVIRESVIPSFTRLLHFFKSEYLPAARETIASYELPNGPAFYLHRCEHHTTTDLSPKQLHELGLKEVGRIRAEMQLAMQHANFSGQMHEFVDFLRTDEKFYFTTAEALLTHIAALTKKADGELPRLFARLPRCPYGVKPIPAPQAPTSPAAYYWEPDHDCSRAGTYMVNTFELDQRPTYLMESTALHEAVPGHHLQIALTLELTDLPDFRRFGSWTAYIEGWALYAESLGATLGFYTDPYNKFGQLGDEILRASRLVVDTGMHALGWSRDEALEYMQNNTPLSMTDIRSEIDRYIADPGQALAYKCGELKIKELRLRAEKELGSHFNIRTFHDRVLGRGPLPLDLLEDQIAAYIHAELLLHKKL